MLRSKFPCIQYLRMAVFTLAHARKGYSVCVCVCVSVQMISAIVCSKMGHHTNQRPMVKKAFFIKMFCSKVMAISHLYSN